MEGRGEWQRAAGAKQLAQRQQAVDQGVGQGQGQVSGEASVCQPHTLLAVHGLPHGAHRNMSYMLHMRVVSIHSFGVCCVASLLCSFFAQSAVHFFTAATPPHPEAPCIILPP